MGTRERMISAAERVMREKGLARTTTKEIAREAGFSEGAIYKHFESKEELFICVLTERLPSFVEVLKELPQKVGRGSVEETISEVASAALPFYRETFPMSASIFSEPDLLARHREEMKRQGSGPQKPNEALISYLEAERDLGRIQTTANPETIAAMLLGACLQRAFLDSFFEETPAPSRDDRFVQSIVSISMRSLSPDG